MHKQTFDQGISKLFELWPQVYKAARNAAIWRRFAHIADDVWLAAIEHLLANAARAPLVNEITDAIEYIEAQRRDIAVQVDTKNPDCWVCSDMGWVNCADKRLKPPRMGVLRCTCDTGNRRWKKVPQWDGRYDGHFEIFSHNIDGITKKFDVDNLIHGLVRGTLRIPKEEDLDADAFL